MNITIDESNQLTIQELAQQPIFQAAMDCSTLCGLGEGCNITVEKMRFWLDVLNLTDEDTKFVQKCIESVERTGKPIDTCCEEYNR